MTKRRAFTLLELLVVISIIAILASLALPHVRTALLKGEMLQTLNNARQLYLATQAMALDASAAGSSTEGWPGDSTMPQFSSWAKALCDGGYLSAHDFCKLCSAPGVSVSPDKMPTLAQETAFTIYPVQEGSDENALFLITRNAIVHGSGPTRTITLDPKRKPYGAKGCVLLRRDGTGQLLLPSQLTNAASIGTLTSAPLP